MTTDTTKTISGFVNSQIPEFIRDGNPLFVSFLEAYYEFMEQSADNTVEGYVVNRLENMRNFSDIDNTLDVFSDKLYQKYMALFPAGMTANKATIAKNIKDFYRSRGSEKSYRFLFHALFGEDIDIYYPKTDILIASSGKWFIEKSVKVSNITVNSVSIDDPDNFALFTNTRITGSTSAANAVVERVLISYQVGVKVFEIFLSGQVGDFVSGETITTTDHLGNVLHATLVTGFLTQVSIVSGGTLYNVGDTAVVQSATGSGAVVYVSSTTTGNVDGVQPIEGGAGFRAGDSIIFNGGGGVGALGTVATLLGSANSFYHANTLFLNCDIIQNYQNVTINAANYGFGGVANSNVNTVMNTAMTSFSYGLTGPIASITVTANGHGYVSAPTADVVGNTTIKLLGIMGRMNIINPGLAYSANDVITFVNPPFCYGTGAAGKVLAVNANGAIVRVGFTTVPGFLPGGTGFYPDNLPVVSIASANGTGANVMVTAIMGYGDPETVFQVSTGSIGTITGLAISSPGSGYQTAPTINLASKGDGTAQAVANIVTGTFTYPGRYLDETGFVSGYSFIEDADYYQNFSYVIKVTQSIDQYRKYVKSLVHPAGTKLWGQYQYINPVAANVGITTTNSFINIY